MSNWLWKLCPDNTKALTHESTFRESIWAELSQLMGPQSPRLLSGLCSCGGLVWTTSGPHQGLQSAEGRRETAWSARALCRGNEGSKGVTPGWAGVTSGFTSFSLGVHPDEGRFIPNDFRAAQKQIYHWRELTMNRILFCGGGGNGGFFSSGTNVWLVRGLGGQRSGHYDSTCNL